MNEYLINIVSSVKLQFQQHYLHFSLEKCLRSTRLYKCEIYERSLGHWLAWPPTIGLIAISVELVSCPGFSWTLVTPLQQRSRRYSLSKTQDTPPDHGTKSIRNKIRCWKGSLVAYSNGIRSAAGGAVSGVHKACRQIRVHVMKYQRQWCTSNM